MSPILKGVIVALCLGLVGVLLWVGYGDRVRREAGPEVVRSYELMEKFEKEGVPDFEALRLDGTMERLSKYRGKVIILSFWATWCAPCLEEFPSMIKTVEKFGGEVVMVGVSADSTKEDIENFVKMQGAVTPHFVNLWDPSLAVAGQFGTERIPENYIIGRDFKLAKKLTNALDWTEPMVQDFLKLLTAQTAP